VLGLEILVVVEVYDLIAITFQVRFGREACPFGCSHCSRLRGADLWRFWTGADSRLDVAGKRG